MQRACLFLLVPLLTACAGLQPKTASSTATAAAANDPLKICEAAAGGGPYVCFDHARKAWIQPLAEISRDGAPLKIVILNTDPDHIVAVARRVDETPEAQSLRRLPSCRQVPKVETIFPEGEGRYTLEIDFDGSCRGLASVPPTEFRVHVLGWEQAVAGGFVGSDHKDPQFSTYTRQAGDQTLTFVEQEPSDSENDARLGLASFIHLYHEGAERWVRDRNPAWSLLPTGFSFGLGIAEQNRTTYAVGPSWRFGNKGVLTAGYSWAPVDRLPNGIRTCPRSSMSCDANLAIADPNRISSLSQRTERALFVSLSYSFITLGSFFEDRFREAIKPSGSGTPQTPTPPASQNLTEDDLELTCEPEENAAGDEVTVSVTVKKGTGGKPVRLDVGEPFEDLPEGQRGDWEPCPDEDGGPKPGCYQLASTKVVVDQPKELKFQLTDDVEAGTYTSTLSVDTVEVTCEVEVTEGSNS